MSTGPPRHGGDVEPPAPLGSWRNLYLLVAGNLVLMIVLLALFTRAFR